VIAIWIDAHRRDVFAAVYRVTTAAPFSAARLEELDGPSVDAPASILSRLASTQRSPDMFVGDGAESFAREIAAVFPGARVAAPPLIAGTIGRLAVERANDAVDPAAVRPLYVRRPDAEIGRDARP